MSSFGQPVSLRVEKKTSKFAPSLSRTAGKRKEPTVQPTTDQVTTDRIDDAGDKKEATVTQPEKQPPITKLSMYSSEPTHHAVDYDEDHRPLAATKISRPVERHTPVVPQPPLKKAAVDEESRFDTMNPMEISDQPIAAFIKNTRKGKRMSKGANADETIITPRLTHSVDEVEEVEGRDVVEHPVHATAPKVRLVEGKIVVEEESMALRHRPSDTGNEPNYSSVVNETGIRITSASFRKPGVGKRERWTPGETGLLYDALSVCGMDFWLVAELFEGKKTHKQIKNKFALEERKHPELIAEALAQRKPLTEQFLQQFKSEEQLKRYEENK